MNAMLKELNLKSILTGDKPTFHHNNQTSESQIDNIYHFSHGSSKVSVEMYRHLCLMEHPENLSSHDVLVGKLSLPNVSEKNSTQDFSSTYSDFVVKKPKWCESGLAGYQAQTTEVLKEMFERFNLTEHIPILTEMSSKMLVLSAEQNFETSNPKRGPQKEKKYPYFSKEHTHAYEQHVWICKEWRLAGRPKEISHPAKNAKLLSQRHLQQISRESESSAAIKNHNELMGTYYSDISQVCSKLKQIRGDNKKSLKIPVIETVCGIYEGRNVLEGFRANTEKLCNEKSYESCEVNQFYEMCVMDNMIIFEITSDENVPIPHMELSDLKDIIFKRLKLNKACDVYKLTVEHLRYCGDETLMLILFLLNSIIDNLNYLSSPQLNTSLTSIVYKGKNKAVHHHKSHRQVRVTPLIGRLIDEFTRPVSVKNTKPLQDINQYGFSEGISYMMGALQRHETEKFCIDMKQTFFGCSLDGESAFEVVDRSIQTRELYCTGVTGQYWKASEYSYKNSLSKIKMNGQLSSEFEERLGVKQGHINSSDHYKIYINPALETLDDSCLGVWIGPVNVSGTGVADDLYLTTNSQSKLQALLEIAAHYGKRYKIKYGASKTKITVVGSKIDMAYYSDTTPWVMDDERVKVVEDNEHLGQVVSGLRQEEKNIDQSIVKGRKSLYGLLGPAFAFKCHLSPVLKMHLFRTFTCPIIRSGLSSFALRTTQLSPLAIFHRKTLKSVSQSPTPAIHFILGELPMEGKLHRDVFSLFYSVWANPNSKIHQVVKYLLSSTPENSHTWCAHLRSLSAKYDMWNPSECLQRDPPSKSEYREYVLTKITAFYEKYLRDLARENSCMQFLHVDMTGLRGKHHPAIADIKSTAEVQKLRPHLKMLCGNLLTYGIKYEQTGLGSPHCRLCDSEYESVNHIISSCPCFSDIRTKIWNEMGDILLKSKNNLKIEDFSLSEDTRTQFLLDPTSMNLIVRVHMLDPIVPELFKLTRDLCAAICKRRTNMLQNLKNKNDS